MVAMLSASSVVAPYMPLMPMQPRAMGKTSGPVAPSLRGGFVAVVIGWHLPSSIVGRMGAGGKGGSWFPRIALRSIRGYSLSSLREEGSRISALTADGESSGACNEEFATRQMSYLKRDRWTNLGIEGAVWDFIVSLTSGILPYLIVPTWYVQSKQTIQEVAQMSAKYVFVTGGVVSSLGKGVWRRPPSVACWKAAVSA